MNAPGKWRWDRIATAFGVALVIVLLVAVIVTTVLMFTGTANAATVERHAICWTPTKQITYKHWAVYPPGRDRWNHTRRPCKVAWDKQFGVYQDGKLVGIHKQRTLVSGLPDPQAGEARG